MGGAFGGAGELSRASETAARWLRYPRVLILSLALAIVVAAPTTAVGYFIDDLFHVLVLEGMEAMNTPGHLFIFADGNPEHLKEFRAHGPLPWWSHPGLTLALWRPLTSWLAATEHALLGRAPVWFHVHSIAWYLLLITGWSMVLRRLAPAPIAGLALALFAIDEMNWMPVGWIANRNALVAVTLGTWALAAYVRWREGGAWPGAIMAPIALGAGLLGGEAALGLYAYMLCYELFARSDAWRGKLLRLVPVTAVVVTYLLYYKLAGYGAYGSGTYIDPLGDPVRFLVNAPGRFLAMMAAQLVMVAGEAWLMMESLRLWQMVAGGLGLVLYLAFLFNAWPQLEDDAKRLLRWTIPAALLAVVPGLATFPANRLLLGTALGANVVTAALLVHWWRNRKRGLNRFFRVAGWYLVLVNVIAPPIFWYVQANVITRLQNKAFETIRASEVDAETMAGNKVVMLAAPDIFIGYYPPIIHRFYDGTAPEAWSLLSLARAEHRLTRPRANTIELESVGEGFYAQEMGQLFRAPWHPLKPADSVELEGIAITVLETKDGIPVKIRCEFAESFDSPNLILTVWIDGEIREVEMPPVGESITIPSSEGLFEL